MGNIFYNQEIKEVLDSFLLKMSMVNPGKMFGYPAYYVNKKLFACVYEDGVGLKVPFEIANELLNNQSIIPFIPMGKKKMREWIQINHNDPQDYINDMEIFETSISFVSSLINK